MDPEALQHLTDLAKLRLDPDREKLAIARLSRVIEAFAVLSEVDTEDVEPSPYPLDIPTRGRPDTPGPVLTQEQVLQNAPESRSGCVRVPRAVDG